MDDSGTDDLSACKSNSNLPALVSIITTTAFLSVTVIVVLAGAYVSYQKTKQKKIDEERAKQSIRVRKLRDMSVNVIDVNTDNMVVQELQSEVTMRWYKIVFSKKFLKYLPKEIWSKKRCYLPSITHIIDQTTDIAVIIEFGKIYIYEKENNVDCPLINGFYLFSMSLFIFLLYRFVSAAWVYNETKSVFDTLLQLLDLKLYHALYINFLIKKDDPTNPQRYLQILEASLESFPQTIIQLYYLIKIGSDFTSDPLITISLIFSIINISSKMISEDKVFFDKSWHKIEFKIKPFYINFRYILRYVLRLIDLCYRLMLTLLFWIIVGGFGVSIYIGFETISLILLAMYSRSLSVLVWIAQTPLQIGNNLKGNKIDISDANTPASVIGLLSMCCCFGNHMKEWNYYLIFLYRYVTSTIMVLIIILFYYFFTFTCHPDIFCNKYTSRQELYKENNNIITPSIIFVSIMTPVLPFIISSLRRLEVIEKNLITIDRNVVELIKQGLTEEIHELRLFGSKMELKSVEREFDKDGNSLLSQMILKKDRSAVQFLVNETNIKLNTQNNNRETALMLAVQLATTESNTLLNDDKKFQRFMEIRNSNYNRSQSQSYNYEMKQDEQEMVEMEIKYDDIVELLVNRDHAHVLCKFTELYTRRDVGINLVDGKGNTALMIALSKNDLATTFLLIVRYPGLDVNIKNSNDETALTSACWMKQSKIIRLLVSLCVSIDMNVRDEYGNTPFMIACFHEFDNIVPFLLQKDAESDMINIDINSQNNLGTTALMIACNKNNDNIVKHILNSRQKVDLNVQNADGDTALMIACSNNNESIVRLIMDYVTNNNNVDIDINKQNKDGDTALTIACLLQSRSLYEMYSILELLLKCDYKHNKSIDINLSNLGGHTAWTICCERRNVQGLTLLLQTGHYVQNISYITSFGDTALLIACRKDNTEFVTLLLDKNRQERDTIKSVVNIKNKQGDSAIMMVCAQGVGFKTANMEIVQAMLDTSCIDLSITNENGDTPLIAACMASNKQVIELLLNCQNSADINLQTQNKAGLTPFDYTVTQNCVPGVKLLIEFCKKHNLNIQQQLNTTQNGLVLAAQSGSVECFDILLSHGWNINYKDDNGWSIFMHAVRSSPATTIEHLINKCGINVINERTKSGYTCLMVACQYRHVKVIQLLLHKFNYPTKNITDEYNQEDGLSALWYAVNNSNSITVLQYLLTHGKFDINSENVHRNYQTLLEYAAETSFVPVLNFLAFSIGNHTDLSKPNPKTGKTMLTWAAQRGAVEILKYLFGKLNQDSFLFDIQAFDAAVKGNHKDVIQFLLENGNITGLTKLCEDGDSETLNSTFLSHYGSIKINTPIDKQSMDTLLILACKKRSLNLVKTLVGYNSTDVNKRNKNLDSPLMIACRNGDVQIVQSLLNSRGFIRVGDKNKDGDTALLIACKTGNMFVPEILIKFCDANTIMQRNNDLQTSLMWNTAYKHMDSIMKQLIEKIEFQQGKKELMNFIDSKDKNGQNAFMWAAANGNIKAFNILKNKGGDIFATDNYNQTAHDIAIKNTNDVAVLDWFNTNVKV